MIEVSFRAKFSAVFALCVTMDTRFFLVWLRVSRYNTGMTTATRTTV